MKSNLTSIVLSAALLTGLFLGQSARAQVTYTQTTIDTLAVGPNLPDKSATAAPNDLITFSNAVREAHAAGMGGVFDLPTGVAGSTRIYRGLYANDTRRLHLTSSVNMQNATAGGGTFTPTSGGNLTTSSANQSSYSLAVGPVFDPLTDQEFPGEAVASIGFVILSRTAGGYPLDLRATVTFSDGTTEAALATIGNPRATDDTFFGFTAPGELAITNLLLESFAVGTENPVADRIGWDDFGFITRETGILPPPQVANVQPANYSIIEPTAAIEFEARSVVAIETDGIQVFLNDTDVSAQLVITGEDTNRFVSFTGLAADQIYDVAIIVSNVTGMVATTNRYYTHTSAFTLFNSEGFTSGDLYPPGNLTAVTHGLATWAPHADLPAEVKDIGEPQGKVLERLNWGGTTGYPDYLHFPPVSSGTLIFEFDAWTSSAATRTIDIALMPLGTSGATMAGFVAWGGAGAANGQLAYFDNAAWQPLAALETDWHKCKITHYLSGPAAGRYDVLVNDVPVGQKIPWRNATVGSAFSRFRLQTQHLDALPLEYGRIDNLVITAAPEDPNAFPPPAIVNISPANGTIIRPEQGLQFEVTSTLPLSAADIGVVVNGVDVSNALQVSGPSDHLTVSYDALEAEKNYVVEINATNASGPVTATLAFIASEQSWLVHPSDGWVAPWQYTSGAAVLGEDETFSDSYLHLDTAGNWRNFMRQYTNSSGVDLNQPHYIRWRFRLHDADFDLNFNSFDDRVHFFARNGLRLGGGTDNAMSWAIYAHGAAQGDGAAAGQTFWIYNNVGTGTGAGAFTLPNHVDSGVLLRPDHSYAFEVLVFPGDQTYSVFITNETAGTSFTSSAPHRFRAAVANVTPESHTMIHLGVRATGTAEPRAFDFGPVTVTSAVTLGVLLRNPAFANGNFSFSFQSQTGFDHVAQYKDNIIGTQWTDLETIPGDDTLKTVTHTNPPVEPLFYRVDSRPQ